MFLGRTELLASPAGVPDGRRGARGRVCALEDPHWRYLYAMGGSPRSAVETGPASYPHAGLAFGIAGLHCHCRLVTIGRVGTCRRAWV